MRAKSRHSPILAVALMLAVGPSVAAIQAPPRYGTSVVARSSDLVVAGEDGSVLRVSPLDIYRVLRGRGGPCPTLHHRLRGPCSPE